MAMTCLPPMQTRLASTRPCQPRPAVLRRLPFEPSRRACAQPSLARRAVPRASDVQERSDDQEATSTSCSHTAEQRQSGDDASGFAAGLRKLGKAVTVGALCLAFALASASPALAARSGGYMGGSNFGSAGRMSSSGGSSFGGSFGGSRMGGSAFDGSRLGGSRMGGSLFDGSRMGGSRMGGYSAQLSRGTIVSPRGGSMSLHSFGWFGPPVFYGGGYGYGYGVPVGGGGGGFGTILLLGIAAAILWSIFSSRGVEEEYYEEAYTDESMARVTVAKLQVGLLGSARQLQRDLERIADKADTDSPAGLHYILQETVLALLRNPELAVYGAAETSRRTGLQAGEARFNEFSMQERAKFKQETLVNVGGRRRSSTYQQTSTGTKEVSELIVVTILVAVEGPLELPVINSLEDVRTSLSKMGGVGADQTLAVEVLWTPQDGDDYYTKDEIFQDYPTLIPL